MSGVQGHQSRSLLAGHRCRRWFTRPSATQKQITTSPKRCGVPAAIKRIQIANERRNKDTLAQKWQISDAKVYVMDVRVMPTALWSSYTMGEAQCYWLHKPAQTCLEFVIAFKVAARNLSTWWFTHWHRLTFWHQEMSALSLDSVDCENSMAGCSSCKRRSFVCGQPNTCVLRLLNLCVSAILTLHPFAQIRRSPSSDSFCSALCAQNSLQMLEYVQHCVIKCWCRFQVRARGCRGHGEYPKRFGEGTLVFLEMLRWHSHSHCITC